MISVGGRDFRHVWCLDFEFGTSGNGAPEVRCMVAHELCSGRKLRLWRNELGAAPPFEVGTDTLLIGYYLAAEMSCFLALGWSLPLWCLDLFFEFRAITNGAYLPNGSSLLSALVYFNEPAMDAAHKQEMRDLAIRGGDYSTEEREALVAYCEDDVVGTLRLFAAMKEHVKHAHSLIRGRYAIDVARMERVGIPVDAEALNKFYEMREVVRQRLVAQYDTFGTYEDGSFRMAAFAKALASLGIDEWPRTATGLFKTDAHTFRDVAERSSGLADLAHLRECLGQLDGEPLRAGDDGRLRCWLSPLRSKTGRNQPPSSQFVFGCPGWLRGFVRPPPGRALAYVDWEQQEFGIAAALSGDAAMLAAYKCGDPYLEFARMAGAVPPTATKQSHRDQRALYKTAALAVLYGMRAQGLAKRLNVSISRARDLLQQHQYLFPAYWRWSQSVIDYATLTGRLHTAFGWTLNVGTDTKITTLQNWPMQSNGGDLMRLACRFAHDDGVIICAPVHDAFLIEAPLGEIDNAVATMRSAMDRASSLVLDGFVLRTEAQVIAGRWPLEGRARAVWDTVAELIEAA